MLATWMGGLRLLLGFSCRVLSRKGAVQEKRTLRALFLNHLPPSPVAPLIVLRLCMCLPLISHFLKCCVAQGAETPEYSQIS